MIINTLILVMKKYSRTALSGYAYKRQKIFVSLHKLVRLNPTHTTSTSTGFKNTELTKCWKDTGVRKEL